MVKRKIQGKKRKRNFIFYESDEKALAQLKEKLGLSSDAEVVRYSLRKSMEAEI